MYLKRLEIQGFKSFAKKTTLEFEPGVTSVVGPNGSGKSNIADCLRWVLGEQSAKLMRGKKSDDVIFAGSDKRVKLGFAEAVATFDNRDHKIPLDVSEVSIGRRVDRSGESEYLINGNKVRLLDIVDLVLKSNIGTSRYTVIGQGTIDQMILAGPSEVKNLIDEASGVKTYYIRRDKTLRRLEQTAQNLMRAEDLMAEIEPRLKSLRRQAKRMEAREEIETELKINQRQSLAGNYWQFKRQGQTIEEQLSAVRREAKQESRAKAEDIEAQLKAAQNKYETARQDSSAKREAVSDLERQLQGLYKQLEQTKTSSWSASQQQLQQLDKSFEVLRQSVQSTDTEGMVRAASGLLELWHNLRKTWQGTDEQSVPLDEVRRQLVELSAKKDSLMAELNKLSAEEAKSRQAADFLEKQLAQAKQENLATSQQTTLEIEKAKVDAHLEDATARIGRVLGPQVLADIMAQPAEPAPEGTTEKIERLQRQLDLIGGVDELTLKEYQETEIRYTNLSTQVEDLKKGTQDLRQIIDELDENIKTKFSTAFHKINEKFEYYFRILFNGGRAYLSLLRDEQDPPAGGESDLENEEAEKEEPQDTLRPEEKLLKKYEKGNINIVGVDMKATPPGKKLSSVQALSGGERALTSIAFLCSLLTCFPSPFVVLDEVDAALDEANTIRFGQILGTLAHQTQFITITHNRETMAQSNALYGITMGDDGISKLLSIKLEQAKEYAK